MICFLCGRPTSASQAPTTIDLCKAEATVLNEMSYALVHHFESSRAS